MIKFGASVNLNAWALPLSIATKAEHGYRVLNVYLFCFLFQWLYVPMQEAVEDPEVSRRRLAALHRMDIRLTKAYADGRQKAPRNRKRKPSKAMRNLYQLG